MTHRYTFDVSYLLSLPLGVMCCTMIMIGGILRREVLQC